jgi:hypothetical protein
VFQIQIPSDPSGLAFSYKYYVNKWKIKSLTYYVRIFFSLSSPVEFICIYENFSSVTWCFTKLLIFAGRWVGSGSVKNLTDSEHWKWKKDAKEKKKDHIKWYAPQEEKMRMRKGARGKNKGALKDFLPGGK